MSSTTSVEVDNRTAERVDETALAALAARVLTVEGAAAAELCVILVDPAAMRALNREHRGHDEVTDVLAFPIDEDGPLPEGLPRVLGDVVICLVQARVQAAELGHAPGVELGVLTVHGILHLLGHDHETDAGEMLARQDAICAAGADVPWE